jgi:hypothetical protein
MQHCYTYYLRAKALLWELVYSLYLSVQKLRINTLEILILVQVVHFIFFFQVCDIQFDRRDILMNKLVATTLESKFFLWDMRTQHPTKGFAMLTEKV